jgi:hypothetical protein
MKYIRKYNFIQVIKNNFIHRICARYRGRKILAKSSWTSLVQAVHNISITEEENEIRSS